MTPIEAARDQAGNLGVFVRTMYEFRRLTETETRAIITAFLEAAAEDEDLLRAIRVSGVPDGRLGIFEHDIKGIVLALKEAVNG